MSKARHLTAKQATELLNISAATLYAYVSRGLIRSEMIEGDSRSRRYNAEDVQKLRERKEQRKNPAEAARAALYWGTPILESALTLITEGGLYYRGYDALDLAVTCSVEQVAALFWTGDMQGIGQVFAGQSVPEHYLEFIQNLDPQLSMMQKLHIALALASANDLAAYDLRSEKVAQAGARILRLMTTVLAGMDAATLVIAQALSEGWGQTDERATLLLSAALILCADHELNVSSFTARVVASAEAQPYAVVIAGLAALQGARHGGSTERAEAMLQEIGEASRVDRVIADRLRRGEMIPGFGHRLYPEGDPRAALLLHLLGESYPDAPPIALAASISYRMREAVDQRPNIDFALAVLAQTLHLPAGAALSIFALGRTIGWIGHAIEQYGQGQLIRPRAKYIGVPILSK